MRVLSVIVGVLLAITGVISVVVYLTFGISTKAPESLTVSGLTAEATVHFTKSGRVQIDASSVRDAAFSLGFSHAVNHSWEILLMRQAALGRLSEWFTADALPEDRLAKRLRLGTMSEEVFQTLDPDVTDLLNAYANGINAGLELDQVRASAPLVLMEIEPEVWEPWHSLSIERLWAWLGSPSMVLATTDSLGHVRWLESEENASDRALRSRLHMFGFEDNLAASVAPTATTDGAENSTTLLFRYITGDSGVPVFQPVSILLNGRPHIDGLSLPGTMFMPAGRNNAGAWVSLNQTSVSVSISGPGDSVAVTYDRVVDDLSHEELISRPVALDGRLALTPSGASPDYAFRSDSTGTPWGLLDWPGKESVSGAAQWLRAMNGHLPEHTEFFSVGVTAPREGPFKIVTGAFTGQAPDVAATLIENRNVRLLTRSANADHYSTLLNSRLDPATYDETGLLWDTTSRALTSFADSVVVAAALIENPSVRMDEAIDYIRAWDDTFDGSSIAASLVATMSQYYQANPYDSLDSATVRDGLQAALDSLSGAFGADMRSWRWETIQNRWVYFPGDGTRSNAPPRHVEQFLRDFTPVLVSGRGHPTSFSWGPGLSRQERRASSVWNGRFGVQLGDRFEYTHEAVSYTRFLGRFLAENRSVERRSLHVSQSDSSNSVSASTEKGWSTLLRPQND